MKLKDIKIGNQLILGLGAILLLVSLLGVLAWRQTNLLWKNTQGLYDHPLQVRLAIGELKTDILVIRLGMKDLCLVENAEGRQTILQAIDTAEADAHRQFDILLDRYLGPRSDVDEALRTFVQWKSVRAETIQLLREGKTAEAMHRTRPGGEGNSHADKVLKEIKDISDFATARADEFYRDATQQHDSLKLQLGLVVAVIILFSLGVGCLLLKGIKAPLLELTEVTDQYRQGRLDARSRHVSSNEFGTLAAAFNEMAATMEAELHINENAAKLASVMLREEELRAFSRALLQELLAHTGSQIGAVYVLNGQRTAFELCESIGLSSAGRASFSAADCEGEFGAALTTKRIQRVTDIPADSRFTFSTVGGDFKPREIITIPILTNEHVAAVISLASIRSYPAPAIRLVNEIWSVLTARINGVLSFRQLREFSEKLEAQNRELDAQKKELAVQTSELAEQNTELEMQKHQLDESNRLKSAFLSNMSHELRTPLNSVIALSGVLNRRLADKIPGEEYGYLEVIERNGRHLLSLINDILDLSRIEAGRADISLTRFPVKDLVGEVVEMIAPQAREKSLALIDDVGDDLPTVTSDFAKCRHILQNLVGNAVKFTATGGVKISARREDDSIEVSVTDTGIGIAAGQLAHIFDEFRQGDESTSRRYGGSGLGLAIAKKYAELLQGRITVTSTPGQGSTFTLRLPLAISQPADGGAAPEPEHYAGVVAQAKPAASGHGHSILLVEDTEPAVIQMTDILTHHGYQVRVARNGAEALGQLEQALPSAVILDLMMPGVDGFQVLKSLRGTERTCQLPVIILTAKHVTREELSFLKHNHIHQLIQKGDINRTRLLAAVAQMVTAPEAPPPAACTAKNRPPSPFRQTGRSRGGGQPGQSNDHPGAA